jgi:hypothetical protein
VSFILIVSYAECHIKAPYAECHMKAPYAECHIKAPYAECRYTELRYAECRGSVKGWRLNESRPYLASELLSTCPFRKHIRWVFSATFSYNN